MTGTYGQDSFMQRRIAYFLSVFLLLWQFGPAGAEPYECDAECRALITDWVAADVERVVPFNLTASERFDSAVNQEKCKVDRGPEPKVHAIVLAPHYPKYPEGASGTHDANFLRSFFAEQGVDDAFLSVAGGEDVTRDVMIAAMGSSLPCVRERDQVVLVLSGLASSYDRWVAPTLNALPAFICEPEDKSETLAAFCAAADGFSQDALDIIENTYSAALEQHNEPLFLSAETKIDNDAGRNDPDMLMVGIGSLEVANFVTQVRNRGADAFVVIDTSYAAAFNLLQLQRDALPDGGWFWNTSEREEPEAQDVNPNLVPLFGSGQFAAFYATADDELADAIESEGDTPAVGPFILAFSEALRQREADLPVAELAKTVTANMKDLEAGQTPIYAASSTGMRFLAPAEDTTTAGQQIEIISPALKRGAAAIEEKSFVLVARYSGTAKAFKAVVDGEIVGVDANGQFRHEIRDTGGKLSIQVRVLGLTFETLAATEVKLRDAEEQPLIATAARKLALVIANQAYASEAFPTLKTPAADADAVADVLTRRYGFATAIGSGADQLNLNLRDASKAQIQQVLFELRRRLTPEDQLIVYYAGHGENDPDLGAFWVPSDGQPKADFTWIAAEEITRELKRMNAGSILVISDSCYAGGLSRGGVEEKIPDEARERYLAKASRLKARQLMASGGVEPVADGGGSGHSVFAKALIEALSAMPDKSFTASELFEQKVKPAVISAANALSEGQTPGFNRIARAGDEPGSEFVFQVVQ